MVLATDSPGRTAELRRLLGQLKELGEDWQQIYLDQVEEYNRQRQGKGLAPAPPLADVSPEGDDEGDGAQG